MDISAKLNHLRFCRETTPAVRAVPSAPQQKSESAVESIQKAKQSEFPVKPETQKKKSQR